MSTAQAPIYSATSGDFLAVEFERQRAAEASATPPELVTARILEAVEDLDNIASRTGWMHARENFAKSVYRRFRDRGLTIVPTEELERLRAGALPVLGPFQDVV